MGAHEERAPYVTLPEAGEITRRLVAVRDEPHFKEHLYPLIAAKAGGELHPYGVVNMLLLAIHDYTVPMGPQAPIMRFMLEQQAPQFTAALIDDEGLRDEALAFWEAASRGRA